MIFMLEFLLLVKFVVIVLTVLSLSILSEKVSLKIAGFVSGLPIGTLITLFFFGFENGYAFASKSAITNIAGMIALQIFIFVYYKSSKMLKNSKIVLPSIIAIISYLMAIAVINNLNLDATGSITLAMISIPIFIYLFNGIKDTKIENAIKFNMKILAFRALVSGFIILSIISLSSSVGSSFAGLLSAFPTTLFPLIIIIDYSYKTENTYTIIKNVPQGILGVLLYSVGVYYFYPVFGIYIGTVLAYVPVIIYALLYFFISKMSK